MGTRRTAIAAACAATLVVLASGPAAALEFTVKNCSGKYAGVTIYEDWFKPGIHDPNANNGYDWWEPGVTKPFSCGTPTCQVRLRIPGGSDVWLPNSTVTGNICMSEFAGEYGMQDAAHPLCNAACKSVFTP